VVLRLVGDLGADVRGRVPEGEAQRGFGLRSLADRAAALGGDLRAAREGDGFVLVMRLAAEQAVQRGAEDEGRLGPDGRSGDGPAPANGDGPAPATGADDDAAAATLREVAG
jgi:hypothetical protein